MRKLILLLAISVTAIAASAQNTAKTTSAALRESKTSGVYVFRLSDNVTQKDVEQSAQYYTHYFTTTFDQAKHEMKIALTENAEMNKHVIQRLMVGLSVNEITVDGKSQPFDKVYETYLK